MKCIKSVSLSLGSLPMFGEKVHLEIPTYAQKLLIYLSKVFCGILYRRDEVKFLVFNDLSSSKKIGYFILHITRTPIKKNMWNGPDFILPAQARSSSHSLKKINAPPFTKQTNKLSMTSATLLYALRRAKIKIADFQYIQDT